MRRLNKEFEEAAKNGKAPPSQAPQYNTPDVRALQGKARTHVPAGLRGKPFS